ncbi:MAG: YqgE/AlgH family protein [Pseudomonadota bacterium]
MEHLQDLTGKLLVAMPGMGDPRFESSVIYLCAHSNDGAMGLIINKPSREVVFDDLLKQLSIEPVQGHRDITVFFGGPVELGRGFVLHSADYVSNSSTLQVDRRIGMTATLDVLEDIAQGLGPTASLLALGYSGWGPGQLEDEISSNGWMICDAPLDLVFDEDHAGKWGAVLNANGIDPSLLSASAGRA